MTARDEARESDTKDIAFDEAIETIKKLYPKCRIRLGKPESERRV